MLKIISIMFYLFYQLNYTIYILNILLSNVLKHKIIISFGCNKKYIKLK